MNTTNPALLADMKITGNLPDRDLSRLVETTGRLKVVAPDLSEKVAAAKRIIAHKQRMAERAKGVNAAALFARAG